MDYYHTGLDVLGAIAPEPKDPTPVTVYVQSPWWAKMSTVIGASASLATLWMAWNWHTMMKKRK